MIRNKVFAMLSRRRHRRVAAMLLVLSLLVAASLPAGCQRQNSDGVSMMRLSAEDGPTRLHWRPDGATFVHDSRGQHRLIASKLTPGQPQLRQSLLVRVLWDVQPSRTGTDPSALNATVGYLVESSMPEDGEPIMLYYEGAGNVLVERPNFGGGTRFIVRNAQLRLARANCSESLDPLGLVNLSADLAVAADPDAGQDIDELLSRVERLGPPGPPITTTAPD